MSAHALEAGAAEEVQQADSVPKLVDHNRRLVKFTAADAEQHKGAADLLTIFHRLGIIESINVPAERPTIPL